MVNRGFGMQVAYVSRQPGWLMDRLTRRPIGVVDSGELDSNRPPDMSTMVGTRPSEIGSSSARPGPDALVLRILDEAASKRPALGLFNPAGFDRAAASNSSPPQETSPAIFD